MDGLSGAASGMAIVSLSFQLLQSVNAIRNFLRHVKEAPAELARLLDLLERFGALLDDVHQTIQLQSSQFGQDVPRPSTTIFTSLKSCERHLEPLRTAIQKYQDSRNDRGSRASKFYGDVKLGLKSKDIFAYESQLQQEMNGLNTALILNSTSIQYVRKESSRISLMQYANDNRLRILPTLADRMETINDRDSRLTVTCSAASPICKNILAKPTTASDVRPSVLRRAYRRRPLINIIGLSEQTISYYLDNGVTPSRISKKDGHDAMYVERIFSWVSTTLGYEFRYKARSPFGSILPSLSVYPIVQCFESPIYDMIGIGNITRIQQAIDNGALHPYMRTEYGGTLLHLAALFHRPDILQFLSELGVKPGSMSQDSSLLIDGSLFARQPHNSLGVIDTFRILVQEGMSFDELEPNENGELYDRLRHFNYLQWPPELIKWFFTTKGNLLTQSEAAALEDTCLRVCLTLLNLPEFCSDAYDLLRTYLNPNTFSRLVANFGGPLPYLFTSSSGDFETTCASFDSYCAGQLFLSLLAELNVDIECFVTEETGKYPDGLPNEGNEGLYRRVIFRQSEGCKWILGWEWIYDENAPGYLVCSEFSEMAACEVDWFWPFDTREFSPWEYSNIRSARFNRRLANKARKELKRSGQKRLRGQMPGSWVK